MKETIQTELKEYNVESSLIFKYKSLSTLDDFSRLIDILEKQRLYLPTTSMLNDVFECPNVYIDYAVAGIGISYAEERHHPITTSVIDRYKVLSFSKTGVSPVMWAHYTGVFNGVCLVFNSANSFKYLKDVQYIDQDIEIIDGESVSIYKTIEDAIIKKHKEWSYEQETRLVLETNDDFFSFEDSDLLAIIIGHNLIQNMKHTAIFEHLIQLMKNRKKPIFKTYVSYTSGKIKFLDYKAEIQRDGSKIRNIELDYLFKHFNY